MPLSLILLLILIAISGFAAKLAREQGGREWLWASLTLAAGLIGYGLSVAVLALVVTFTEAGWMLAVILGPVLSLAAQALTLFALYENAQKLPKTRDDCPAYCLGSEDGAGWECRLKLLEGQLLLEGTGEAAGRTQGVPYSEIREAVVTGECLELRLPTQALTLQPGTPDLATRARTRLSQALRDQIAKRLPR